MPQPISENPFCLFHRLWTKAVGTEGYDKEEWKRLEAVLLNLGLRPEGQPKDWRIGRRVKTFDTTNEMYGQGHCLVVDVAPAGTYGFREPLLLRSQEGRVFYNPAEQWEVI